MRLFFAYWPSPEKAAEIEPWVKQAHALFGGRMMRTETLHMTLAFLGEVDPTALEELVAACTAWQLPTGSMTLRQPGRFKNAKVVWLGPDSGRESEEMGSDPNKEKLGSDPISLAWLQRAYDELWAHLAPLGWQPREAAFRPHVSLLRNAGPGELDVLQGTAVHWSPERCVLVGSRPTSEGSRYTVLAELPLVPT